MKPIRRLLRLRGMNSLNAEPHRTAFPVDDWGLTHRRALIDAGYTDNEIVRACRHGQLVRIARGVYARAVERSPDEQHRLTAVATVVALTDADHVLSHQSAATMHGLAMLRPNLRRVHLTIGRMAGGHRTVTRHTHVGELDDDEIVVIDGIRTTSLERTAVDVACSTPMGFAGALAVFDSALRLGADRDAMARMLSASRRGVAVARRALRHADGAAENPGESWSRAQMIEAGLPVPRLQHEFVDRDGEFVARTDHDWAGRLVGEFDGAVKYQKHLRPGETPFDAMRREKQREDRLRRMGIMVIRWTWRDLERGVVAGMVREWLTRLHLMAA
ncbi:hypothetical protein GCM10009624_35390 [Gordonia sinesedis]